jgi:class 3 adenylate cyclase
MPNDWKAERAQERIEKQFEQVREVKVVDYAKDMSLENIPVNKAYRMHAAHLYADILNLDEILGTTDTEGTTCHKRTLRFLNLHYRAVERILNKSDTRRVDFHNQRLHCVVAKPYDDERSRVSRAVAIGNMIRQVLSETGKIDDMIPNAKVRIGIDTGMALVVNNGRRGGREPLFLGKPANVAAKCAAAGRSSGIFLANQARLAIGLSALENGSDRTTPLTSDEIAGCEKEAKLDFTKESIIKEWNKEQEDSPIGEVEFSRPTPPLRNLDIQALSLANSKRFEGCSVYADIDGFTAYVDDHIEDDDDAKDVVRVLHVLRSELDQVVSADFSGRRVRFVGDCIHGLLLEGTAHNTDEEETVSTAVLCAGGLRSSFDTALKTLEKEGVEVGSLGFAIGVDFGPISVSRLGIKGTKVRCAIGRNVLQSEAEQQRCGGEQTAIGQGAYDVASEAVQDLFSGASRRVRNLDYDAALHALAPAGDKTAKKAEAMAYEAAKPALVSTLDQPLRPHTTR